jgi:vibriolysin
MPSAMMSRRHSTKLLLAIVTVSGCATGGDGTVKDDGEPDDVSSALAAMPNAEVLEWTSDGLPTYIVGELTRVGAMQTDDPAAADAALRPSLGAVLAPMRMKSEDLVLRHMNVDEDGNRHFRYAQTFDGIPVIGGDLVVHVDVKGAISGVNGTARGDLQPFATSAPAGSRAVYLIDGDGIAHNAFESIEQGMDVLNPYRNKIYTDASTGTVLAVHPTIYFAENRKVYSANNGSSTPGTLKRTEGQPPTSDLDVNAAYDNTGDAYEAYKQFWNRDSYDNAGGVLISTVHYSVGYCNAYWDGSQMVYGDGSSSEGCGPLARSTDVTAHELTHAVTERESALVYSGESGGINESLSDIFGTFVEAWADGGKTGTLALSANTWIMGEDVVSGGVRNMCDPAADGASRDYYTSSIGSTDVHYSSGLGNLAFCLMTKGGTHPRGKSNVNVPGIGMDKAIRIFYKAQVDILTSNAKYSTLRTATQQAAAQLGYDQATQDAVGCAWAAVGVGSAPASCGTSGGTPTPPPTTDGTLTNGVAVTNISDTTSGQKFWKLDVPAGQSSLTFTISGGSGDADLYVQLGTKPTISSYACRPYKTGNSETCTFTPPSAGTYWVMLNGYDAYSGVSLKGTYSASGGTTTAGDPYLTSGVAVTNASGAASSAQYWRITAPAGKSLRIAISGGTGDADLYTRFGSRPTTSSYACRPYLNGNAESCTTSSTQAGDYYVMVRGYSSFSGVSLVASY